MHTLIHESLRIGSSSFDSSLCEDSTSLVIFFHQLASLSQEKAKCLRSWLLIYDGILPAGMHTYKKRMGIRLLCCGS